jgi:hypothetical protein
MTDTANPPSDQGNPSAAIPVYIVGGTSSKNITTNTGTLVKTGPGSLASITVGTAGTTTTATVYDGTNNTGTLLGTLTTTAQGQIPCGWPFTIGLYLVTAGGTAANLTVTYN